MHVDRLGIDTSVSAVFPPAQLIEVLEDADRSVTVTQVDGEADALEDCHAVVTFEHYEAFFDLEWVHSIQAGVDRFPLDRFRAEGITLTNSTGIHGDAIGETVAAQVLVLARRFHEHVANQGRRRWSQPDWDDAWTVTGERACVVGLGGLGRGIVDRLSGLGMDVVGVRRSPLPEPGVSRVYPTHRLHEAISDARFVILAVPLTDETTHLIDADALAAMRSDAYLVNVARGPVVDESALIEALENDEIAGAALDVFETEPLPESSPLWDLDDVIVSPHCGAFTRDYYRLIESLVRESLHRIRHGEEPVNRVV